MQPFFSRLTGQVYQGLVKPLFFKFDAERVHEFMVANGVFAGKVAPIKSAFRSLYAFEHPSLEQRVLGISFKNPLGLAAGFDYNAQLTQILSHVGFGFQMVGTISAEPFEGNPKPRLGRLPKSRSLLVNKGYKNPGVDAVIERLARKQFQIPVGFSIGSTNREFASEKEQIQDFLISFEKVERSLDQISHYELNISCPNLKSGEKFLSAKSLTALLQELEKLAVRKPIFMKMPTDVSTDELFGLLRAAEKFNVHGAVIGNLTKDRKNPDLDPDEVARAGKGNFSGKPTQKRTNALLKAVYQEFHSRYVFIGTGGVFSAKDAYRKIKLGATLVQMITGMIYQGPQVVGQINQGLTELLHADGYEHISEAIGADNQAKRQLKQVKTRTSRSKSGS